MRCPKPRIIARLIAGETDKLFAYHARIAGLMTGLTSLSASLIVTVAAEFFVKLVMQVFPAEIEQALADNGSEFCGAFDRCLQEQGIRHCCTYPKCPKMNAFNERFNRALQEEFAEFEDGLLLTDMREFNERMINYPLWFNTQRPHYGLELQAPMAQITQYPPQISNMCWRHTRRCADSVNSVQWRPGSAKSPPAPGLAATDFLLTR